MKLDMKTELKRYVLLTAGALIMAIGNYFFKFTNNFTFGGITGLSVLVSKTGIISASDFNFIANMALLLLGLIILGKGFIAKTAYCTIILSGAISVFERLFPMTQPFTDQLMLEFVFAVALPSLGASIIFNLGASSGGTDVIAMIIKKYSYFNIGNALLISNFLIALASFVVFDTKTGLYSLLGVVINSTMIDTFIESLNLSKYFNIVCDHPEPICDYITHSLNRSASIINAKGAFSGEDKYIIFTVLNRSQAVKLRNFIKQTEPTAFLLISNTSEIIGKGFHSN